MRSRAARSRRAPARAAAEDVHGAIDARVRDLADGAGDYLHAGRSRNDQVATALALYVRDRAERGAPVAGASRARRSRAHARPSRRHVVAATTHWQPAQPVLLAFWLGAVAENFARATTRFERVASDAAQAWPLGAAACCGTGLPLDRAFSANLLGFAEPARNALDTVGDRDLGLDLLHATARALTAASRVSEELVLWCTPAFGYARLADAASTGSSIMPQKRNPDPFELVRGAAAAANGAYAGAARLDHRRRALVPSRPPGNEVADLARQRTRAGGARGLRLGIRVRRLRRGRMNARAGDGYTLATDLADALTLRGLDTRRAHALVGARVLAAEREGRALDASDLNARRRRRSRCSPRRPARCRRFGAAQTHEGSTHPDRPRGTRSTRSKRPSVTQGSRRRRGRLRRGRVHPAGRSHPDLRSARSRAARMPAKRSPPTCRPTPLDA